MVQNWCRRRSGIYTPLHPLASCIHLLPICCLLLAMHVQCQDVTPSVLFHIEKIAIFQIIKNKIDEQKDMIGFGEFPSLYLESPSAVTSLHYVCYLHEENKSGSSVNELRYS